MPGYRYLPEQKAGLLLVDSFSWQKVSLLNQVLSRLYCQDAGLAVIGAESQGICHDIATIVGPAGLGG